MKNMINKIVSLAKLGNVDSIEKVFKEYRSLIFFIIKRYNFYVISGELDDLIQEGNIGLLKAIKTFDSNKEISFKHFATICIKSQIISFIKKQNTRKYKYLNSAINYTNMDEELSIDNIYSNENNPEKILLEKEKYQRIFEKIIDIKLSNFEEQVYLLLVQEYTYQDIIILLNKEPKKIDNAIQRVRRKIKKLLQIY